jgi:hypothetical protein
MKKLVKVNEFNVVIDGKVYILDIREVEKKKSILNCSTYSCMSFDSDMVPYKRFNILYNLQERLYWAWTMDVIRGEDRTFREYIAELLNNKTLQLK